MNMRNPNRPLLYVAVVLGLATALAGCGKKDEASAPDAVQPATVPSAAAPAPAAAAAPIRTSWTPEQMEELLAPVALYPDPILMQVLSAAGNPQEVLDAGNWLLQNQSLKGDALGAAAEQIGFTPPTRALLPFPATLDMMCQEMAWTTELGQAFVTDQQGVLDAVQRLRFQAQDVGNLKSSPQMEVSTQDQGGEQVIYLKPADPEVVYVPQYDPVAAYAPAPATTTTTVVQEGHSTGAMVTTGLLAFGAGLLVADIFDDDDDWDNYYPRYGYGGGYNYNNYPYRPAYGNGYYPSNGYNRPPNYNNGWQNNGNINTGDININTGGNNFNNIDGGNRLRTGSSPISKANPNRDMSKVNQRAAGADGKRPGAAAGASDWKGQSSYAGAKKPSTGKPSAQTADRAREQAKAGGNSGYAGAQQGQRDGSRTGKQPKVQGGYAGAKPANRDAQRPEQQQRPQQKQAQQQRPQQKQAQQQRPQQQKSKSTQDRGHGGSGSRQQASRQKSSGGGRSGGSMSGASHGGSDRSASQRGKQSSGGSSQKSRR
ncbi:MAG: DUF3300 domain-containing protein [Arenimonas sp.]|nr:DUF3300 domain-containing protein [Arenimonas sp.]